MVSAHLSSFELFSYLVRVRTIMGGKLLKLGRLHLLAALVCFLFIGCSQVELKSTSAQSQGRVTSRISSPVEASLRLDTSLLRETVGNMYLLVFPIMSIGSKGLPDIAADALMLHSQRHNLVLHRDQKLDKVVELKMINASISVLDFIVTRKVNISLGFRLALTQNGNLCWVSEDHIESTEYIAVPNSEILSSLAWQAASKSMSTLLKASLLGCERFTRKQ